MLPIDMNKAIKKLSHIDTEPIIFELLWKKIGGGTGLEKY